MVIKGKCYNISLNGKTPLWGYYLFISESGDEYIIKRNSKIPFDRYRKVYKTKYSFKNKVFLQKVSTNLSTLIGVPLGLLLVRIFRKIIPMDIFFGKPNLDLEIKEGFINVLLTLVAIIVTLWLVTVARYIQLKRFVEKNGEQIELVGEIKPLEYIQKSTNGTEVW